MPCTIYREWNDSSTYNDYYILPAWCIFWICVYLLEKQQYAKNGKHTQLLGCQKFLKKYLYYVCCYKLFY